MAQVKAAVGSTVATAGRYIAAVRAASKNEGATTTSAAPANNKSINNKNVPSFPPAKQKFLGVF
jgi:hypothetical protein